MLAASYPPFFGKLSRSRSYIVKIETTSSSKLKQVLGLNKFILGIFEKKNNFSNSRAQKIPPKLS